MLTLKLAFNLAKVSDLGLLTLKNLYLNLKTLFPTLRRFCDWFAQLYTLSTLLADLLPQDWHSPTNRQESDLTLQKTGSDLTKMI